MEKASLEGRRLIEAQKSVPVGLQSQPGTPAILISLPESLKKEPGTLLNWLLRWLLPEQHTYSFVMEIEETIEQFRRLGIKILKADEIAQYFAQHPDMIEATRTIIGAVVRRVPVSALALKVYRDPEIEDEHLELSIKFPEFNEQAIEIIRSIEDEILKNLVGKSGWLSLIGCGAGDHEI